MSVFSGVRFEPLANANHGLYAGPTVIPQFSYLAYVTDGFLWSDLWLDCPSDDVTTPWSLCVGSSLVTNWSQCGAFY